MEAGVLRGVDDVRNALRYDNGAKCHGIFYFFSNADTKRQDWKGAIRTGIKSFHMRYLHTGFLNAPN
jgi:hypothetical protein